MTRIVDPFDWQKTDGTYDQLNNGFRSSDVETSEIETKAWPNSERVSNCTVPIFADDLIHKNITSFKQRQVFAIV